MDDITGPASALPHLQQTVQRKLGRCLLRLQQYERLVKAMIASSGISGPSRRMRALQEEKTESVQKKTLGTLVGIFTENYLTHSASDEQAEKIDLEDDLPWISFRLQAEMSLERLERTKSELKELVELRNKLVHHFIEFFDIQSERGCIDADDFLDQSFATIDQQYRELHDGALSMQEVRTAAASFVDSQMFEDILNNAWETSSQINGMTEDLK